MRASGVTGAIACTSWRSGCVRALPLVVAATGIRPRSDACIRRPTGRPRCSARKSTFEALARDSVEAYFHGVSILRDGMRTPAVHRVLPGAARRLQRDRGLPASRAASRYRRSAGAGAVPRPEDLSRRRHQHEGRSRQHGAFAGSARAAHGSRAGRVAGARLPSSLKVRGREGKWLLKKAMEPRLPARCAVPAEDGVRGAAGPLVPRAAARARARSAARRAPRETGIFDRVTCADLLDEHQAGVRDYSAPLWTLLMFDAFLRNVMRHAGRRPAASARPPDVAHARAAHPRSLDAAAQRLRVSHGVDPARAASARAGTRFSSPRRGRARRRQARSRTVDGWRFHRTPPVRGRWRRRCPVVIYVQEMNADRAAARRARRDVPARRPARAFAGAQRAAGAVGRAT